MKDLWDTHLNLPLGLSFTADGKFLARGAPGGMGIRIADLQNGGKERFLSGHLERVTALARSRNKWLVSAGKEGTVLEWDQSVLGREQAQTLRKQDYFKYRLSYSTTQPLTSVDLSADGKWILTGGEAGQIQLWDGLEHVLIGASFKGHNKKARIESVAMAADGSFFVTADHDRILVWPGPDSWADLICSQLAQNMSVKLWREWISPQLAYTKQCPGLPLAPDQVPRAR